MGVEGKADRKKLWRWWEILGTATENPFPLPLPLRTAVENIRSAGRATQGVIVMRFKEEGDQVIAMALTDKDEEE